MAANGISTLSTKQARQLAKLDIAQTKRKGWAVNSAGVVPGSVPYTIGYQQNNAGSASATGFFFRPTAGKYDALQVGWYVYNHPDWVVTNIDRTVDGGQSVNITISGGHFLSGASYAFGETLWLSPDTSAPFYRARNVLDITQLPDTYNGNQPGIDDNPNVGGLVQGRPWTTTP